MGSSCGNSKKGWAFSSYSFTMFHNSNSEVPFSPDMLHQKVCHAWNLQCSPWLRQRSAEGTGWLAITGIQKTHESHFSLSHVFLLAFQFEPHIFDSIVILDDFRRWNQVFTPDFISFKSKRHIFQISFPLILKTLVEALVEYVEYWIYVVGDI